MRENWIFTAAWGEFSMPKMMPGKGSREAQKPNKSFVKYIKKSGSSQLFDVLLKVLDDSKK